MFSKCNVYCEYDTYKCLTTATGLRLVYFSCLVLPVLTFTLTRESTRDSPSAPALPSWL